MDLDPTDPDTWQQHCDRPAWVRRHRDALADATGLEIPRSLARLPGWLERYKATVTRKLREQTEANSAADDGGGGA